jgi:hypothetical protein
MQSSIPITTTTVIEPKRAESPDVLLHSPEKESTSCPSPLTIFCQKFLAEQCTIYTQLSYEKKWTSFYTEYIYMHFVIQVFVLY